MSDECGEDADLAYFVISLSGLFGALFFFRGGRMNDADRLTCHDPGRDLRFSSAKRMARIFQMVKARKYFSRFRSSRIHRNLKLSDILIIIAHS